MRFLNKQVPPRHPHPRSQQGITLIELMIALVIGLLATGAMLKVYVDSSRLYRFNESLARIQENGRFGLEFIRRDARMAGFRGCNHEVSLTIQGTDHPSYDSSYITGTNGSVSDELGKPDDPDSITFLGAGRNVGTLSIDMATDNALNVYSTDYFLDVYNSEDFESRNAVLISDCESADIFRFTGVVEADKKITTVGLSKLYAAGSSLYSVQMVTYCIAPGTNSAQPSLRRLVTQTNGQNCATDGDDLVEGIENMQILMGEDTDADFDGSVNRYVYPGHAVAENLNDYVDDRIVSVRISLLAVSPYNNVTTEPAPYFFNGAMVGTVSDRYLRKEFTTTVALRNKNRIRYVTGEGEDGEEDKIPDGLDACFAPLAWSGGSYDHGGRADGETLWKNRADLGLTTEQEASATACWSDGMNNWVVGCNTAASLCTEDAAHFNADKWQYVKTVDVEGVEVKLHVCGGSLKSNAVTQQEVKDNAAKDFCSGCGSSGKCKTAYPYCNNGALWDVVSGTEGGAKFGGVGYRCGHTETMPSHPDGTDFFIATDVEGNEREYDGGVEYYLDNRDNGCLFDRDEFDKNKFPPDLSFSGFYCEDGAVFDPP